METTLEQKAENIKAWQEAGFVHPLTCGVSSSHAVLEPDGSSGNCDLVCPTCGWRQREEHVPEFALLRGKHYIESYKKHMPEWAWKPRNA